MLIRLLGMRRTVFVTPLETAPVILAACTRAVAARERRKLLSLLAESGVAADPGPWLKDVEETALRALTARGEATAAELAADDPRLQAQIVLARGKAYEGRQAWAAGCCSCWPRTGGWCAAGRGSWASSQYRWAPLESWCPDGLADWDTEAAEVELARRWLAAFGPATAEDLRWWAGWSAGQVKRVLTRLRPTEVDLDGVTGLVLSGDLEPVPAPEPWAALLPPLDSTPMGWSSGSGSSAPRPAAVRPHRQCGPHGVVGRPGHRRLGAPCSEGGRCRGVRGGWGVGRSRSGSSRTPGRTQWPRWKPPRSSYPRGSARSGSRRAAAARRRWSRS